MVQRSSGREKLKEAQSRAEGVQLPPLRGEAPSGLGQPNHSPPPIHLKGPVQCREHLKGMLKFYYREAA